MWPFKNKWKPKPEHYHLISNFEDGTEYLGIGMAFTRNKKRCRVAIRLENDFTVEEFKEGFRKLAKSVACPFDKGSGVLFDDNDIISLN